MRRIMLPLSAALAVCTSPSRETAMSSASPAAQGVDEKRPERRASTTPSATGHGAEHRAQAAVGPIPEPVSAAENPAPAPQSDLSAAAAQGRRILSTAFVREDAHRHLTVELNDGRVLVLRDVVMRKKDFCGLDAGSGAPGAQYCGRYADVVAARPGGAPVAADAVSAASNPVRRDR